MTRTGEPAVRAGARTPICAAGGALRERSAVELALAAARGALSAEHRLAAELGAVVVVCSIPESAEALALGSVLAEELGAGGALPLQLSTGASAGMEALAVARVLCATFARPVLAVGVESASRAPYWASGLRWGPADGAAHVSDPIAASLAAQGRRGESLRAGGGGRAAQDAFADRSRRLADDVLSARPAGQGSALVDVGGADRDEPPMRMHEQTTRVVLKPVFSEEGTVTVATTALPADGAAALVLAPGAEGPTVCEPALTARAALDAAGLLSSDLDSAEIHEGTAAEALAIASELGIESESVNPDGGAIGQGAPFAACGLLMALRLVRRLDSGQNGLISAPGCSIAVRR